MHWWLLYGDYLSRQYQENRLKEASKEDLAAIARGRANGKGDDSYLLTLVLAFVHLHLK
jgi:hypothetical protein